MPRTDLSTSWYVCTLTSKVPLKLYWILGKQLQMSVADFCPSRHDAPTAAQQNGKYSCCNFLTTSTLTSVRPLFGQCSQCSNVLLHLLCFSHLQVVSMGLYVGEQAYLRSSWNILDGFLVFVSLIDIVVSMAGGAKILGVLRVLRLLRTLRPLRYGPAVSIQVFLFCNHLHLLIIMLCMEALFLVL